MDDESLNLKDAVAFVSVTPLYCLVTDADEINLSNGVSITRFSEEQLEFLSEYENFTGHLRLHRPQCLLWERRSIPWKNFIALATELSAVSADRIFELNQDDLVRSQVGTTPAMFYAMHSLVRLIRALQLYKRGRLVVGDSFFYFPSPVPAGFMVRCTDMTVDYHAMQQYAPLYELNSSELHNFLIFLIQFYEASRTIDDNPEIVLAIGRYCKETAQHGDVVDLMIALESLLVPEEEGIAFKLSQRVANLLGPDAMSRKYLFQKIREFYGLRSKVVHGAKARPKEIKAQEQIDELREITRQIILSVIALASESGLGAEFAARLNEMCLDDDLRRAMQEKASALLDSLDSKA